MAYPQRPRRPPGRFSFRRYPAAWSGVIVMAVAGLSWAGYTAWNAIQTWGTPVCSWPLIVRGTPDAAQAGLARCYVHDLAQGDATGLLATAAYLPPVRITRADFKYEADARAGLATVTITPNPNDTTDATMSITFADGAHEELFLQNMNAMSGPSGWRVCIGTDITPNSGPAPAPAKMSPAALSPS